MPHDPHAQFDDAVLDIIEHSPIGAVPYTPAYQDALKRLYAAHKVYANADHKDCHVTARSLAGRPSFHAENFEALAGGRIDAAALESNSAVFDRYIQSLPAALRPKAETHRLTVAGKPIHHRKHVVGGEVQVVHDPLHALFLVPGCGPHPGLPGNYLYGYVVEVTGKSIPMPWTVHVHDCDDGLSSIDAPTLADAFAHVQEVIASAPFQMSELEALGFVLK